ncbi:MAG: GTP-binding protein, partial [Sphingomonadaceae bacterium]|nr:GTP-binding protein [Sphingomonadaceae bacterium]
MTIDKNTPSADEDRFGGTASATASKGSSNKAAAAKVEVEDEDVDVNRPLRIAIAGRPNVGKSTLINRLLGEDRLLTGPEAGITRDSIGIEFDWHGRQIKMFDTAGIRRRSRVEEK